MRRGPQCGSKPSTLTGSESGATVNEMISFVEDKMCSIPSVGSHKVIISDFHRPMIEVVYALLKDPANEIDKPPKCSHLVLGNAFLTAIKALTSDEYGKLVNQKEEEQLRNVILLLDRPVLFSDRVYKAVQETTHPNTSFAHCLDLARQSQSNAMVCAIGVICLAYFNSMTYLEESLTEVVPTVRGYVGTAPVRLPTFLRANAHMMQTCHKSGRRGECKLEKVFDFEKTILQYGKQITMYKLQKIKTEARWEETRKIHHEDGSVKRARHSGPAMPATPPPPSTLQSPSAPQPPQVVTSSVKRLHDVTDEMQNLCESLSSLTRKMQHKLEKDRSFTIRDVQEIIHDMHMAPVDRMRKSLDEFVELVDDNFNQQKEDALREQYALMNEQSWIGTKTNLKRLPDDPLQLIKTALSETTRTMKKYNSDDFFTKFVHDELGPLFEKFPSVRLQRRSKKDIEKSIRNGDDLRDDIITQLLLTMHHSIAGQEGEVPQEAMGWCSVLVMKLNTLLQKKDEPMREAAASSKPKEEQDEDSDSYTYTDGEDSDDGAK